MPTAVIVAYDPAWPVRAQQLLNEVRSVLVFLTEADHFAYEHIGSTAVPGLAAKPIVDLQVRMPSLPDLADLADILGRTPFVPAHGARPDSPGVHRDIPRPGDATDAALYEKRLFHAPSEAAILTSAEPTPRLPSSSSSSVTGCDTTQTKRVATNSSSAP